MARPRLSDDVKKRRGTYEPKKGSQSAWGTDDAPVAPSWLNKHQAAVWQRIVPQMVAAGLVGLLDSDLLTQYCCTYAAWVEVAKLPPEYKTVHMLNVLGKQLQGLGDRLGLSPTARLRLAPKPQDDDPMTALLKARQSLEN